MTALLDTLWENLNPRRSYFTWDQHLQMSEQIRILIYNHQKNYSFPYNNDISSEKWRLLHEENLTWYTLLPINSVWIV